MMSTPLPFDDTPESFETFAVSPGLAPAGCRAVVCVPTYKRPALLARTLASLQRQETDLPFAVIVVENEGQERAGAAEAASIMARGDLSGMVIVEPRQGNCKAYNAAWRCALTRFPNAGFVCGIDDDEEANPRWLAELVAAAETSGAGIVGGSVTPIFEDPQGERYRLHPIFRSHYDRSGPAPIIYSSANYLIRREVIEQSPWPFLDESFDFTGGGDTHFFTRARARGVRFHWAQEASMTEIMPSRRTERSWISARGYRNGIISALIERKMDGSLSGQAKRLARTAALLAAAPFRSLALGLASGSAVVGRYHLEVALGRVMAELGMTVEQYRKPEKN
jgi:glycosyltransferase involved in cell wall biosynthesis